MHMPRLATTLPATLVLAFIQFCTGDSTQAAVDFDKYCKAVYSPQSRAVMLNARDANSWRCTKGNEQVSVNMDDLCHRLVGPNSGPHMDNASDANSWSCVPHDVAVSGTFTPARVNADEEEAAKKLKADGKTAVFGRRFYFTSAASEQEFNALAKHSVFLISVWVPKPDDLPVKRVYIRANNQDIAVIKASSWRSEVDGKTLTAQVYGPHREDGFYLVPAGPLLRDGELLMDFGARTASVALQLPSAVMLGRAKTEAWYKSPDAAPNAKPELKAVQDFIRRKFPGFPVPASLP